MPNMFLLVVTRTKTTDKWTDTRGNINAIRSINNYSAYEMSWMQLVHINNMTRQQIFEAVEMDPDDGRSILDPIQKRGRVRFLDLNAIIAAGEARVPKEGNRVADNTDVRSRTTEVVMDIQQPTIIKVRV